MEQISDPILSFRPDKFSKNERSARAAATQIDKQTTTLIGRLRTVNREVPTPFVLEHHYHTVH
jgi:hypothetical protein